MTLSKNPLISFVVPVYNESAGITSFHKSLVDVCDSLDCTYEIVYCDDGSADDTAALIRDLCKEKPHIRLIKLSRNFGKEAALTAGIAEASGDAIMTLDGDGQHPVALIPTFLKAWREGARVVVGVRSSNQEEGSVKKIGSKVFYSLFNKFSTQALITGSTDFRLIDKEVKHAFLELKETERITRGLIDWLGFDPVYVQFDALPRASGVASYNSGKLIKLATNSFVSLTVSPLYFFGYFGIAITLFSFLLGFAIVVEQLILGDPYSWNYTGTAMLGILIIFLVGIVLMSQGILALYISHIQNQSKARPLYVIDEKLSVRTSKNHDA